MSSRPTLNELQDHGEFARRHIGPDPGELAAMLATIGVASLDELLDHAVPDAHPPAPAARPAGGPQRAGGADRAAGAGRSATRCSRRLIGMGYYGTVTPPVIQRNLLENPAWYTAYTPYQPEISQGRLEALLNFQTMVADLTGLDLANASMLDEGTAAAEAMTHGPAAVEEPQRHLRRRPRHPSADDRRAADPGRAGRHRAASSAGSTRSRPASAPSCPTRARRAPSPTWRRPSTRRTSGARSRSSPPTSSPCVLLSAPGHLGADIVVGSAQRFGVPMGFGGPHAAFLATRRRVRPRRCPGASSA